MTQEQFNKLRYGNVLKQRGGFYIVQHVVRDENGNAKFVSTVDAIPEDRAADYELVSEKPCETFLASRPDGHGGTETFLKDRTVQVPPAAEI